VHVLLAGIDDNRTQGSKIRGDMAAGFDRPMPGLRQADNQPVNAAGKVVKVLFNAIENESLASLIAVHRVVMHKNLHGLFLSDQRVNNGGPVQYQSASTAIFGRCTLRRPLL
jgi:hypothetical protein